MQVMMKHRCDELHPSVRWVDSFQEPRCPIPHFHDRDGTSLILSTNQWANTQYDEQWLHHRDDRLVVVGGRLKVEQVHHRRCDAADTESLVEGLGVLAVVAVVDDDARHRVERVARLGLWITIALVEDAAVLGVLEHIIGVAVVGAENHDAAGRLDRLCDPADLQVHPLHRADHRLEDTGVPDHVAVGEVELDEIPVAALHLGDDPVGDLGALHPRPLFEGDDVAGHLDVLFKLVVELAGAVAVEEVGDMAELLRLADGELPDVRRTEVLGQRPVDRRRGDQVLLGYMQVAVVLHHAGVLDVGVALSVELLEVLGLEGLGQLQGAVAAEVEEDDAVAVLDGPHRRAALGDDERRKILIDGPGLLSQRLDGTLGAVEEPALAEDVGLPSALYHVPVGVVPVHRDDHPSAAAGDPGIEVGVVEGGEERLEGEEVLQRAELSHITPIEQGMDAHPSHPLALRLSDHRLEVVDMGVDVPVAEQTDEVQRRVVLLGVGHQLLPDRPVEHRPALDRCVDQLGSLAEDASAADGVVSHLAVAHVLVAGKADGKAVGLQLRPGIGLVELVQIAGHGGAHAVTLSIFAEAHAIHDDQDDRALAGNLSHLLQCCYHTGMLLHQRGEVAASR